jgi:hypothetical protein
MKSHMTSPGPEQRKPRNVSTALSLLKRLLNDRSRSVRKSDWALNNAILGLRRAMVLIILYFVWTQFDDAENV